MKILKKQLVNAIVHHAIGITNFYVKCSVCIDIQAECIFQTLQQSINNCTTGSNKSYNADEKIFPLQ